MLNDEIWKIFSFMHYIYGEYNYPLDEFVYDVMRNEWLGTL